MAEILNNSIHSLNNSKSKQKYGFSQGERFAPVFKSPCQQPYYQIPTIKSGRAASFGFGQKLSLDTKRKEIPPPDRYLIRGQFQQNSIKRKKGCTFGYGRQEVLGGHFDQLKKSKLVPGPGNYSYRSTLDSKSPTFKTRLPDLVYNQLIKVPGPGHYDPPNSINQKGKYFLSQFPNSNVSSFSPKTLEHVIHKQSPGPGTYQTSKTIDAEGKYYLSSFRNSKVRTFEKAARRDPVIKQIKDNPGPGSYKKYSQFG